MCCLLFLYMEDGLVPLHICGLHSKCVHDLLCDDPYRDEHRKVGTEVLFTVMWYMFNINNLLNWSAIGQGQISNLSQTERRPVTSSHVGVSMVSFTRLRLVANHFLLQILFTSLSENWNEEFATCVTLLPENGKQNRESTKGYIRRKVE